MHPKTKLWNWDLLKGPIPIVFMLCEKETTHLWGSDSRELLLDLPLLYKSEWNLGSGSKLVKSNKVWSWRLLSSKLPICGSKNISLPLSVQDRPLLHWRLISYFLGTAGGQCCFYIRCFLSSFSFKIINMAKGHILEQPPTVPYTNSGRDLAKHHRVENSEA